MNAPHPLRCETCKNKDRWGYCPILGLRVQSREAKLVWETFTERCGCASHSSASDVKELFRKEIAKWKDEDPLFMAYVYGQEAERKRTSRVHPIPNDEQCRICSQAIREKVLSEFLHKKRKKADCDDDGRCPYDSCVLCEIKAELRQKAGEP